MMSIMNYPTFKKAMGSESMKTEINIIAHIHSDFKSKFGIPRQSGLVDELEAEIIFEPEYRSPEALRGIEGFVAALAVFGMCGKRLVADGAPAKAWRQHANGRFCNPLPVQTEFNRAFMRKAYRS